MTKFSLAMGVGRREPMSRIGEFARAAEEYGFHGIWVQDNPLMTKDAYMALTVAALNTSRLFLAPGVSNTLLRHVSVIVNSIATLDQISDGRAVLGVGMGGLPLLRPLGMVGRVNAFREHLSQMRTLLQGGEVVGPDSSRYRVGAVVGPIPVYVAAAHPRMLAVAGELADGVIMSGVRREALLERLRHLSEGAERAGRAVDEIKVNVMVNLSMDSDPEKALAPVRASAVSAALAANDGDGLEMASHLEGVVSEIRRLHDPSMHFSNRDPAAAVVTLELARMMAIVGNEEECRGQMDALLTLNPHEVMFRIGASGRMEQLQKLAQVVRWYH